MDIPFSRFESDGRIIRYEPPTPEDLARLKIELGNTGEQMARLFGLGGANQWHKYTGGSERPRPMSFQMLFTAGALLDRTATVEQVIGWCRRVGAKVEIVED